MEQASTNYSPRPWMQNVPVQVKRPNDSYQDAVTGEALAAAMTMPADQIRAIRPMLPINTFPDRFGYRDTALGIEDVVHVDNLFQRYDFTGRQSGYQGTSYPSLNNW